MGRKRKPIRSGYPRDLRDAGPSGEVKTYWQPEAFTWYGQDATGGRREPFVYLGKSQMRISSAAARAAGLKAGDKLQIGVNKQFLAIKKSETGFSTYPDRRGNSTHGLLISVSKLMRELTNDGWPIPCRASCVYDERSGMLVARKPPGGDSE